MDESLKNLEKRTDEEWQTQKGDSPAWNGDKAARYLRKEFRKEMSDEQKRETEKKERKGSRQSHRYVTNTEEAK